MRTKNEVIAFLNSKVGTKVAHPGRPDLDGQCVTLIKALMEFLGVKDPYKARGHAKTVISAYLAEGIAKPGTGFISVFSNKNMGGGYGHIWCNAGEGTGTYYESNGAVPLIVTTGKTYPYDNVCNFDEYLKQDQEGGAKMTDLHKYLGVSNDTEAKAKLKEHLGEHDETCDWGNAIGDRGGYLGSARRKITTLEEEIAEMQKQIKNHQCSTIPESNQWVANGRRETFTEGNKTITINYEKKQ